MNLTNLTLLSTTVYGQASGNYDGSSLDFYGDPTTAANYYAGQGSLQTVNIDTTDFVGVITIQASLNDSAGAAAWFDVLTIDASMIPSTEYQSHTITGNFVWMRARVTDFEAGTINSIALVY